MKSIIKVFSGLYDMYLSGRGIFVLMLLGIFASNIVLIYCYSTNVSSMQATVGAGPEARYYFVPNVKKLTPAEAETLTFGDFEDDIAYRSAFFMETDHPLPEDCEYPAVITNDGERIMFTAYKNDNGIDSSTRYARLNVAAYRGDETCLDPVFGKADLRGEADGIILPYYEAIKDLTYDKETNSYGTAIIRGHSYRIVGVVSGSTVGGAVISWEAFTEYGYSADFFEFYTGRTLSHSENTAFCETLEASFGDSDTTEHYLDHPYRTYDFEAGRRAPFIAIFFLLYLVSMVTLVFYTNYFTERQMRRNAILHVCGASKSALAGTLVFGLMAVCILCFFAAFAVYSAFAAVSGINIFGGVVNDALDIVYMLISAAAAPFILTVPAVRKLYMLSAAELCRVSS